MQQQIKCLHRKVLQKDNGAKVVSVETMDLALPPEVHHGNLKAS